MRHRPRDNEPSQIYAIFQQPVSKLGWYLIGLVIAGLLFQFAQPIVMGDTDMWYHLSGGRYFWTTGNIPDHPYFSFAFSEREWIAYYWGFQALIYPVFDTFGYQGLVVLRAALFTAGFALVSAFLYQSNDRRVTWVIALVAILYLLILDLRALQLRPHLVSYAMIPLFQFILEHRKKWMPALPVFTAIWGNLHGVEWVVGATIAGAYFLDWSIQRYRKGADAYPIHQFTWLLLCLPALWLNPFGWEIMKAPFAIPAGINLFVSELKPLPLIPMLATLVLLTAAAIVHNLLQKKLHISHLLMAAVGLYLLTSGIRYIPEWALLSLPLFATSLRQPESDRRSGHNRHMVAIMLSIVIALPALALSDKLPASYVKYPFDKDGLPAGIMAFLRQHAAKGNLLISPALAGYANWAGNPDILIYSDMQFPPFDSKVVFRARTALAGNKQALGNMLAMYPVDFIALTIHQRESAKRVTDDFPFVPVFFDDSTILYASTRTQAAITAQQQLQHVDPHDPLQPIHPINAQLSELERIRRQWPEGRRVNHAIAKLLVDDERYAEALEAAKRFLRLHPVDPNGHYLVGRSLEGLKAYDQAIDHYRQAMHGADADLRKVLQQRIGSCHYLKNDFLNAYAEFKSSINIHIEAEDPETLFRYAYSSIIADDIDTAELLLESLLWAAPPEEDNLINKSSTLLDQLHNGEPGHTDPIQPLTPATDDH